MTWEVGGGSRAEPVLASGSPHLTPESLHHWTWHTGQPIAGSDAGETCRPGTKPPGHVKVQRDPHQRLPRLHVPWEAAPLPLTVCVSVLHTSTR